MNATSHPGASAGLDAVPELLPSLRSTDEIASGLTLSINTLKTHIRSIYSKLGVSSRRCAVLAAHEHGLILRPDPRIGHHTRRSSAMGDEPGDRDGDPDRNCPQSGTDAMPDAPRVPD
jgi:hypothetical protein